MRTIPMSLLREVIAEYVSAREKVRPFVSTHEGYAVMLEELDELWDEIKKKNPDTEAMREEAIQVAAMALSFIVELT